LNLVEWLITSRYLFLCVWICLSVLIMFFSCCIVIKLHPSWHIFHNHWCMPTQAHLLWFDNFLLYTSNLCHNTKPIQISLIIQL
jgi:hypothetical protein